MTPTPINLQPGFVLQESLDGNNLVVLQHTTKYTGPIKEKGSFRKSFPKASNTGIDF